MLPGSTCRSPIRPADRRRNVAVDKIQLGVIDRRLIGADRSFQLVDRGLLRIHLLLRHRAGILQQPLVALVVQLGIAQGAWSLNSVACACSSAT